MIKTYNDVKYLTPPKIGFTIMAYVDIGAVQEVEEREDPNELKEAVVSLVLGIIKGRVCQKCKGKINTMSDHIGKCL